MSARKGTTLLEVLVVISLLAVLIGLLMVAVQKARVAAEGVQGKNGLRQIILAIHAHAETQGGRVPGGATGPTTYGKYDISPFVAILPHLEVQVQPSSWSKNTGEPTWAPPPVTLYHSPTDPSYTALHMHEWVLKSFDSISYAVNMQAMVNRPTLTASFADGTSQTIAVAEHYFVTMDRANNLSYPGIASNHFSAADLWRGTRSATFADRGWDDVCPITTGNPAVSRGSVPGQTFQVAPKLDDADGRRAQAFRPSGLEVALFDGSVRTFRPDAAETVFWAFVTPNAGDSTAE